MERKYYIHLIGGILFLVVSSFLLSLIGFDYTSNITNDFIAEFGGTEHILRAFDLGFKFYFSIGVVWYILFTKAYRNFCVFMDGVNDERRKNKKKNSCKDKE